MRKSNLPRSALILFSLFICGCSQVSGKLLIMEANYRNSRGMYGEAIASYLQALQYEDVAPYAEYGLGSVYFSLGEEKAALDRFVQAGAMLETFPSAVSRELRYRLNYNTGVVLFSSGDFSGAADSFRDALRADSGKVEAKRNLELSIRSLERQRHSGGEDSGESAMPDGSRAALFEYVRQKELDQWKSRDWPAEEDTRGPDY